MSDGRYKENLHVAANRLCSLNIYVIGDFILDSFLYGHVDRISPEAPVPVLLYEKERYAAGGAGNVAINCSVAGASGSCFGIIGSDDAGRELVSILHANNIDCRGLKLVAGESTSLKTRVMAGTQQIIRIDRESAHNPGKQLSDSLLKAFDTRIKAADAVIISDYCKGLVSERLAEKVIRICNRNKKPVIVDSKKKDISCFAGCSLITPNKKESENITGIKESKKAAKKIAAQTGGAVLVTEGSKGMTLFDGTAFHRLPALAREVFDVTGAGDTVAAFLALGLASGLSLVQSARLSNLAASIVVGKYGTASVTADELDKLIKSYE